MKLLKNNAIVPSKLCLSYDTEILTLEHGVLSIGKIVEEKIDCLIYVRHPEGFLYIDTIAQYHVNGTQEVFEYTLENGATIKATKDHKFMTIDGQMLPIDEIFERDLDLLDGNSYIVDGYDFKEIMPDSYSCSWYHGNTCGLEIIKFDSHYFIEHQGCTETYREYLNPKLQELENQKKYEPGLTNWMLSNRLYYFFDENEKYSSFSCFVNDCINGYRNITYVKQQQAIDSSFTLEKSKTPKHTYIALNNAIKPSIQLYRSLQDSGQFNEDQLSSFSNYLLLRGFPNHFRLIWVRDGKQEIDIYKEIFDYLIANPSNTNNIVTDEMIEEFQQRYKEYLKDTEKYGNETIEERRDRLNKEIVARGGRAIRYP